MLLHFIIFYLFFYCLLKSQNYTDKYSYLYSGYIIRSFTALIFLLFFYPYIIYGYCEEKCVLYDINISNFILNFAIYENIILLHEYYINYNIRIDILLHHIILLYFSFFLQKIVLYMFICEISSIPSFLTLFFKNKSDIVNLQKIKHIVYLTWIFRIIYPFIISYVSSKILLLILFSSFNIYWFVKNISFFENLK